MTFEKYYQKELYPLQDRVLSIVAKQHTLLYLTGGTALSRFYLRHRYSDDLDFFCNAETDFVNQVKNLISTFRQVFAEVEVVVSGQDFLRTFLKNEGTSLKIEFINDVPFHYLEPIKHPEGWKLDNWENIFSNKLSAISRDEPKDFADLLFLGLKYNFNWVDLINSAKNKDAWVNEITIAGKFDQFNTKRFSEIRWIHPDFVDSLDLDLCFKTMSRDILLASDNSLYGKKPTK